ncbi:ATP-binding protein [Streptomyces sp. HK10]|uniref:ATP-binding protein n=1 Tax=Streptomyces sp. HK10 TaxID=3373255 RepID=UPI003747EDC2
MDEFFARAATAPVSGSPLAVTRSASHLLADDPRSAGVARRRTARFWNREEPGLLGTVRLIVSELVTNALVHGHPPLRLVLIEGFATTGKPLLRIEVWDRGRVDAVTSTDPDHDAECGRGLMLVAELADSWGVVPAPARGGTCAWVELGVPGAVPGCSRTEPHTAAAPPRAGLPR